MGKRISTCIQILLPWVVGLLVLSVLCFRAYRDGRNFVAGFHVMKWMFYVFVLACWYLPALIISIIWIIAVRKRHLQSGRLALYLMLVWPSLIVPIVSMAAVSHRFDTGRAAAYASLDTEAIYRDCEILRKLVAESDKELYMAFKQDSPFVLPPAIYSLPLLYISATEEGVIMQLDGGGPMYHEGVVVYFPSEDMSMKPRYGLTQLDKSLPVFSFRVDDSRALLDREIRSEVKNRDE